MLEAAEAEQFQCPICLTEVSPCDRVILSACAHLFCIECAKALSQGSRECALCRQALRREAEILRVREPGAVLPEEREERRRWGRFGSKLFRVVSKLHEIEQN